MRCDQRWRQHVLLHFGLLVCLAACRPLPKDQVHFARGYKAYEKGDFYTAVLYLKPLIEEGHPAAQLLMAKMYANGQGVEEDMNKAELLRNLASLKIYSRGGLPPGVVRPSNAQIKAISDRVDYYTDPEQGKKPRPVQDLTQLLTALDLPAIKDLAASTEAPEKTPPPSSAPIENSPVDTPADGQDGRRADHISLGLIRRAAGQGDPLAMNLLATAYAKGYYGLTPSPQQSARWTQAAANARGHSKGPIATEEPEPEERLPYRPLSAIIGMGVLLMAAGVWRFRAAGRR